MTDSECCDYAWKVLNRKADSINISIHNQMTRKTVTKTGCPLFYRAYVNQSRAFAALYASSQWRRRTLRGCSEGQITLDEGEFEITWRFMEENHRAAIYLLNHTHQDGSIIGKLCATAFTNVARWNRVVVEHHLTRHAFEITEVKRLRNDWRSHESEPTTKIWTESMI